MNIALLFSALWVSGCTVASGLPTLPYYDWNACPFECCTYREWTVERPVVLRQNPTRDAPVVGQLEKDQAVRGVAGVVITRKYGITKILEEMQLGSTGDSATPALTLKPGEVVFPLHYLGEGYDLFWFKGKTYSDQIAVPDDATLGVPFCEGLEGISRPETEWWVMVQDNHGLVGWSDETDAFEHMDSCE